MSKDSIYIFPNQAANRGEHLQASKMNFNYVILKYGAGTLAVSRSNNWLSCSTLVRREYAESSMKGIRMNESGKRGTGCRAATFPLGLRNHAILLK